MSTAALEAAMAGMEAARAAFEAAGSRVGDELSRLQETVHAANGKVHGERVHITSEERKRRRRSGGAGGAVAAQGTNPDATAEETFENTVEAVDERLQDAHRTMAPRPRRDAGGARGGQRCEIDGARARVASASGLCEGGAERGLQ